MKRYCTVEQECCSVCLEVYDTGALLIDKRVKPVFEDHTVTGYGLCPECEKYVDDNMIALVEVTNIQTSRKKLKQEEAQRTGRYVWVNREGITSFDENAPMGFIDVELMEHLLSNQPEETTNGM